jgi:hypothetical protein
VVVASIAGANLNPDSPVFPEKLTCEGAWKAETSQGAEASYAGPFDPMKGLSFTRPYQGKPASVAYLCSDGIVSWRLIYVKFDTEKEARLELERQITAMTGQLGEPCWDPKQLTSELRQVLRDGVPPNYTEWNVRPGVVTSIWAAPVGGDAQRWHIIINTGEAKDIQFIASEDDSIKRAWELSACDKGTHH